MPSEEMHDISLINAKSFFQAKGLWALGGSRMVLGHRAGIDRSSQCEPAHETNRWRCGVHVDRALKLCGHREGFVCVAKVRTGFGKSDHPGSQGGLGKRGHG